MIFPGQFHTRPDTAPVLIGHKRGGVVDAPGFALLADLNFRHNRVNARRGVIDIGDRAGGRHRLQVLVIDAVAHHIVTQLLPHFARGQNDPGAGK